MRDIQYVDGDQVSLRSLLEHVTLKSYTDNSSEMSSRELRARISWGHPTAKLQWYDRVPFKHLC